MAAVHALLLALLVSRSLLQSSRALAMESYLVGSWGIELMTIKRKLFPVRCARGGWLSCLTILVLSESIPDNMHAIWPSLLTRTREPSQSKVAWAFQMQNLMLARSRGVSNCHFSSIVSAEMPSLSGDALACMSRFCDAQNAALLKAD